MNPISSAPSPVAQTAGTLAERPAPQIARSADAPRRSADAEPPPEANARRQTTAVQEYADLNRSTVANAAAAGGFLTRPGKEG